MGPLRPEASRMLLLFLLLLLLLGSGPVPVATSRRSHVFPRGIKELADTVTCVGPRPPIVYMQYGCFCGLGGHGQPRDSIDWCCYHHDCCYALAEEAGCSPKMGSYPWKCVDNQVQCACTQQGTRHGASARETEGPSLGPGGNEHSSGGP
ncbi:group 10 secretory phospholipase A2 isoform X2 [Heterocephalus glaber]|uniref:Phospholipase A2 n=1 Tax=Heterocephalus glaber TaxID=10181 RepID=A0AAX6R1R0_HETGA|nr:group 10 secretory phospholipase A2 isoform X2 [Heterocephalus glaber]